MYCVVITFLAREGTESDVRALFEEFVPLVEAEAGVISFQLQQSASEPRSYLLYELYTERSALEAHRTSPLFATWRPRIAALEDSRTMVEYQTIVAGRLGK